jgi:hypothetical protein
MVVSTVVLAASGTMPWGRTGWADHPDRLVVGVDEVMGEAGRADHLNGIKPPIPPDAARGYIGVGVSAQWTIPRTMI